MGLMPTFSSQPCVASDADSGPLSLRRNAGLACAEVSVVRVFGTKTGLKCASIRLIKLVGLCSALAVLQAARFERP